MQILLPLWNLRPYDESDPRCAPLHTWEDKTGEAAALWAGTVLTPPAAKAWLITAASGQLTPDAADAAVSFRLRVAPFGGGSITSEPFGWRAPIGIANGTTWIQSQHLNFLVVGGVHQINAAFGFVAGSIANRGVWTMSGYEIPRGDVYLR